MSTSTDNWRRSRLEPAGPFLVIADLHNHTVLSDGRGDPEAAFQQMRHAGLDVAALTDHASIPREHREDLGLHQASMLIRRISAVKSHARVEEEA